MKLRDMATPLTLASSIPLCVTGLCLLLRFRGGLIDPLHEISSLLFLVGLGLHVAANGRATLKHLKRPLGLGLSAVLTLLTLLALGSMAHEDGRSPHVQARRSVELMLDADIPTLARLTRRSEAELLRALAQAGAVRIEPGATLRAVAGANHQEPMHLLGTVLGSGADAQGA